MKRLGSLCLFASATLVLLSSAAFAQPDTHHLQRKILQAVQIDKNAIDIKVGQALSQYYNRTDFSDPEHTTGWYRVDDFLKWVHENRDTLSNKSIWVNKLKWGNAWQGKTDGPSPLDGKNYSLKDLYVSNKEYLFWVYLGSMYIADKYNLKPDFTRFSMVDSDVDPFTQFRFTGNTQTLRDPEGSRYAPTGIVLSKADTRSAIPVLINIGIHEGTHLLPQLTHTNGRSVGELATFYSQYNYALPIKPQDAKDIASGVRDLRLTHKYRPDLDYQLPYEYHAFVIGILLNKFMRPKDILEFNKSSEKHPRDLSLWEVALPWVAIYNKKWFNEKETIDFPLEKAGETLQPFGFTGKEASGCQYKPEGHTFYLGKVERTKTQLAHRPDKWLTLTLTCKKDQGQLTIFYWPVSGLDFLQVEFPQYGKSKLEVLEWLFSTHSRTIKKFYDKLIENLPPDLIKKIDAKWERRVGWELISDERISEFYALTKGHEEDFAKAILAALEEAGAPPSPAVPEGYL